MYIYIYINVYIYIYILMCIYIYISTWLELHFQDEDPCSLETDETKQSKQVACSQSQHQDVWKSSKNSCVP